MQIVIFRLLWASHFGKTPFPTMILANGPLAQVTHDQCGTACRVPLDLSCWPWLPCTAELPGRNKCVCDTTQEVNTEDLIYFQVVALTSPAFFRSSLLFAEFCTVVMKCWVPHNICSPRPNISEVFSPSLVVRVSREIW